MPGPITGKEIVERRHGELIKFLPKVGLLGSQATNEKKFVFILYLKEKRRT